MGSSSRPRPRRLPDKLLQIRLTLELTQNELISRLGYSKELFQGSVSAYELGKREPSLLLLLRYAKLAGVCVDILIDDELELPEKLPGTQTHILGKVMSGTKRSKH